MAEPETKRDSSISVQIIVAIIGLVGVVHSADHQLEDDISALFAGRRTEWRRGGGNHWWNRWHHRILIQAAQGGS